MTASALSAAPLAPMVAVVAPTRPSAWPPAVAGAVTALAVVVARLTWRQRADGRAAASLCRRLVPNRGRASKERPFPWSGTQGVPAPVVAWLERAAVPGPPAPWWWGGAAVVGSVVVLAAAFGGAPLAALTVVVVLAAALAGRGAGERRGRALAERELPVLLDHVAAGVRSGASFAGAFGDAIDHVHGVVRSDIRRLAEAAATIGWAAALAEWRTRRPTAGVRLTVAALGFSAELGGVARPIEAIAATLRARLAIEREAVALSAQARASAVVIIAAPVVFLLVAGAADAGLWAFLARTPLGFLCLAGGIAADGFGAWWMGAILRRVS